MKNPKRASISSVGSTDEKRRRRRRKKLQADICSQVEFYFSDANLRKDRFLGHEIKNSSDGCVPLDMIASFNKIRSLTDDRKLIVKALHKSKVVEVSPCGTQLRRRKPLEEPKYDPDDCTVYVECLPKTADIEWLQKTFRYCGNVVYVSLPRYQSTGDIKGFAFVEYETPEEAARACQLMNNPLDDYGPPGHFPKTRKGRYINIAQPEADRSEKAEKNEDGVTQGGRHDHKHSEHRHHSRKHHHHEEDNKGAIHDKQESGGHVNIKNEEENVGKNTDTDEKHREKEKKREKRKRKKDEVERVEDGEAVGKKGKKRRKRVEDVDESREPARSERKAQKGQETERLEGGAKKGKGTERDIHEKEEGSGGKEVPKSVEDTKKHQQGDSYSGLDDAGGETKAGHKGGNDLQDTGDRKVENSAVQDDATPSEKGHIKGVKSGGVEGKEKKTKSFAKTDDEIQSGSILVGRKKSEDDCGELRDEMGTGKMSKDVRKRKRKGDILTGAGEDGEDGGSSREPRGKKRKQREGVVEKESRGDESCHSEKEGKAARRKRKMSNDENMAEGEVPDDKSNTLKSNKKAKHMKENGGDSSDVGIEQDEKDIKSTLKEIRNADRGGEEEAKKKKRTRQQRKEKEEPQLFLRVLSKAEWLKLKKQYLHLQKIGLQEMKEAMRAQWRSIVEENKKNVKVEEEIPSKPVDPGSNQEPPKISNIEFVEGVVVSIKAKEPVSSRKTLREQLEAVAPVAYVDLQDGDCDGFVRFKTRRGAETVVSHKFESLSGISFELIKGEEEKAYWDKLRRDQENKLNYGGNSRKKRRGRQKIMDRVLKSSGPTSHMRFDEDA